MMVLSKQFFQSWRVMALQSEQTGTRLTLGASEVGIKLK